MRILVAGGAGYIGSVVVAELSKLGHEVVVVDNLSRGHARAVLAEVPLHVGDVGTEAFLSAVFAQYQFDAVMHFCALSLVGESVQKPLEYYQNNVGKGLTLLQTMKEHGVRYLIFSSTAAIFGEPEIVPIPEDAPKKPTNPYGRSKLIFEEVLEDCERAWGLRSACLRYFNAAGATPELGEDHQPETHLIPLVLDVAAGRRPSITVFGNDYPTPDGTCIRDYIHVVDLARAHVLALNALLEREASLRYNLGNGKGFSVLEVIRTAERVTGRIIPFEIGPRRAGDPAVLVASSERIQTELGWKPQYPELADIIASAWEWRQAHPDGYGDGHR